LVIAQGASADYRAQAFEQRGAAVLVRMTGSDVDCAGHASGEFDAVRNLIDMNAHGDALGQPNPREHGIDISQSLAVGGAILLGDAVAAHHAGRVILAAAGYNFRRLLAWLALLLSVIWAAVVAETASRDQIAAA